MNAAASPSPPRVGCVRPWYCWMPITTAHTLGVAPGAAVLNGDGRGAAGRATAWPVPPPPPPPPPPPEAARAPPPPPLGRGRSTGVGSAGPTSLVVATAGVSGALSGAAAASVVTGPPRVNSRPSSLWADEQAAKPRLTRRAQATATAR